MNSVTVVDRVKLIGELTTFSHSIFALPFALAMVVIVQGMQPIELHDVIWILVCVVSARTSAMSWNRYLDAAIDAENVRTKERPIPRGAVSRRDAVFLTIFSGSVFIAASAALGLHCLLLAPIVLALLLSYSAMKRFSSSAHFVLGLSLACAPGGVWYALVGNFSWIPVPLMVGVALWVSGFDILYSCQDVEFDRREGLYSVPAKIGISRSLVVARLLHVASCISLVYFGVLVSMGWFYFAGLVFFGVFVASQHWVISESNVSRIGRAFFTRNGAASFLFLLVVIVDQILRR